MDYIFDNLIPILAATAAGFAFGTVYYIVFKGPYARLSGTADARRRPLGIYATVAIAEFWLSCILAGAVILAPPEAGEWTMGIGAAIIIWIGFVMPATVVNTRIAERPWGLAAIDSGHWLGVMVIQAAVMLLVGVEAPT